MDWDFWANNKDTIETIFTVIGGLIALGGVIWAVFKWGVSRWWTNRVRGEVKVFELITDRTTLLSKLYATENDNSPLADHNIKYQPRDPERDMQADLKAALNRSRYLLVTAPTGYGKTREAGMLAQTMMLEGWRVLRIRTGWLDMPKTLPEELGGNRSRVLIFLDDLNGLFSTGNLTQSPRVETEKSLLLSQSSYHDRLLQVLDMFAGMCTENEIRVIATARSEAEQWKVLEFSQYDRLWKRFERVELPELSDSAIVNLLEDTTKQADIKGNESEFEAIARKSDGTYRNILLNLRRWRSQNGNVNTNDFTETLNGSWQDIYERAVKKHPAVRYVYDAIDILNQARIELFLFLVEPTAVMLWGGNYFQRLLNKRKISRAIHYLTKETTILKALNGELSPSDGQVEVNKDVVSWNSHSQFLFKLLFESSNKNISASIYGLAISFDYDKQFEYALELIKKYVSINPSDSDGQIIFGNLLDDLKRYIEAEAAYRKAIELDPQGATAYFNLGILLKKQKRYDEAEANYRQAIELDPQYANAYNNLGSLLNDLKRYDEAEANYRKVIELDPQDAYAYNNLGNTFYDLKRFDEAEVNYRKAIELDPHYAIAYNNLGLLLDENLNHFDEAEINYRKAIELDTQYASAYINLGSLLDDLKRFDEAEVNYRKAIELNPKDANAYSKLGILLKNLKRFDEAEANYRKAIELNPQNDNAYYNLGILLINMKRFDEAEINYRQAIELNPQDAISYYYNLGILLKYLKRYDEAEVNYRKAIELNPEDDNAYINLGSLLDDLRRFDEAEAAYRKAIELNPQDADTFYNLGNTLKDMKRFDEAETAYRKAIELNPQYTNAYYNLVRLIRFNFTDRLKDTLPLLSKLIEIEPENFEHYLAHASVNKELGNPMLSEHLEKANQFMPEDDWYDHTCLESILDNFDLAFENLQKAAQEEGFNPKWAWEDTDLQWIRNDPRFTEIVGAKPE
jgi:tetratricopeptide (TPR) repeat protein